MIDECRNQPLKSQAIQFGGYVVNHGGLGRDDVLGNAMKTSLPSYPLSMPCSSNPLLTLKVKCTEHTPFLGFEDVRWLIQIHPPPPVQRSPSSSYALETSVRLPSMPSYALFQCLMTKTSFTTPY